MKKQQLEVSEKIKSLLEFGSMVNVTIGELEVNVGKENNEYLLYEVNNEECSTTIITKEWAYEQIDKYVASLEKEEIEEEGSYWDILTDLYQAGVSYQKAM